ncbi:PLAT/LH2 domain-containing protein [Ditylenchus destructor]|nr:PLAT/LH2 domain-containing protein [Ditylenchus destructor]
MEKDNVVEVSEKVAEMSDRDNEEPSGDIQCSYSVVVRTSAKSPAEDFGTVVIQLIDVDGNETDKWRLKYSITHRTKFKPGHSDLFVFANTHDLSDLAHVNVFLMKKKQEDYWVLHSINVIKHTDMHILYRFPCHQNIGEGDEPHKFISVRLNVEGAPYQVLHEQDFLPDL